MPGLFVTATGTNIGKTFVTAGLLRAGLRAGRSMAALKPVLSGFDAARAETSDSGVLLTALGIPLTAENVAVISPWRFAAPLSPEMAAVLEGRSLDLDAVIAACRAALTDDAFTLIEGVGGVMSPLAERHTGLDLLDALALPVLLVTGSALGAMSHCLTAVAALKTRAIAPAVIVLNETPGSTVPLDATARALHRFCPDVPLVTIPRSPPSTVFEALLAQVGAAGAPTSSRASGSAA